MAIRHAAIPALDEVATPIEVLARRTLTRDRDTLRRMRLLREYHATRDSRSLDDLVREYTPLVRYLALKLVSRGQQFDDSRILRHALDAMRALLLEIPSARSAITIK